MSFQIILMENLSPSNYVEKDISNIATATGNLREGSSIIDPQIEIESALESDILSRVNYVYIELFHRYYYITNIELDITGLWLISMHVDVLMSYKDDIRSQNAIVARQAKEGNYNMMLDDGWFMAFQDPLVYTPYFSISNPFEQQSYILVVAGN